MLINFTPKYKNKLIQNPRVTIDIKAISNKLVQGQNTTIGYLQLIYMGKISNIVLRHNDLDRTVYKFDDYQIAIHSYVNKILVLCLDYVQPNELIKTLAQYESMQINDMYSIIVKNIHESSVKLLLVKYDKPLKEFELNVFNDSIVINKFKIKLLGQTSLNKYICVLVNIL